MITRTITMITHTTTMITHTTTMITHTITMITRTITMITRTTTTTSDRRSQAEISRATGSASSSGIVDPSATANSMWGSIPRW